MSSLSSSDESCTDEYHDGNIEPYNFEPVLKQPRVAESSSNSESDNSEPEEEHTRLGNKNWCKCGQCNIEVLVREKEHFCCLENAKITHTAMDSEDGKECITTHPDFAKLCLDAAVLKNVLVGLSNVRGDHWDRNNRSLRFAAYTQFTWWIYNKLGKGRRRTPPACVLHKIRSTHSKTDKEEYEGYHSGDDEEHNGYNTM